MSEGEHGRSVDPVFINTLLKGLDPAWLRPWGANIVRFVPAGSRTHVIESVGPELKACLSAGGDTTLMVWADVDDDLVDADALKKKCWEAALRSGITRQEFERVVFVFAKDRLENWVEYLRTGRTDEGLEGPRIDIEEAEEAAHKLARACKGEHPLPQPVPPSLEWSCRNWRALVERMKR